MLTSRDNETWDVVRVGTFAGTVGLLVGSAVALALHWWNWNPVELGGALAALLGGGGAGVGMKVKDEPSQVVQVVAPTPTTPAAPLGPIGTGGEP